MAAIIGGPHQNYRIRSVFPNDWDHLFRISGNLFPGNVSIGLVADLIKNPRLVGVMSAELVKKIFRLLNVLIGVAVV